MRISKFCFRMSVYVWQGLCMTINSGKCLGSLLHYIYLLAIVTTSNKVWCAKRDVFSLNGFTLLPIKSCFFKFSHKVFYTFSTSHFGCRTLAFTPPITGVTENIINDLFLFISVIVEVVIYTRVLTTVHLVAVLKSRGVKQCALETALPQPQPLIWTNLCKCFFFLSYGKLLLCVLWFHPVIPQWFYVFHVASSLVWVLIRKSLSTFCHIYVASVFNHCLTFCRCGCMSFLLLKNKSTSECKKATTTYMPNDL